MRLFLSVATVALLAVPAPAAACMAHPMPDAVLFDRPPTHRPTGYALLKVVGRIVPQDGGRLLVRIVEPGRARQLGPLAWLEPKPETSCTTWGCIDSEAYAVTRVAGRLRGRALLSALVYRRSGWDRFWNLFGRETYLAPASSLHESVTIRRANPKIK